MASSNSGAGPSLPWCTGPASVASSVGTAPFRQSLEDGRVDTFSRGRGVYMSSLTLASSSSSTPTQHAIPVSLPPGTLQATRTAAAEGEGNPVDALGESERTSLLGRRDTIPVLLPSLTAVASSLRCDGEPGEVSQESFLGKPFASPQEGGGRDEATAQAAVSRQATDSSTAFTEDSLAFTPVGHQATVPNTTDVTAGDGFPSLLAEETGSTARHEHRTDPKDRYHPISRPHRPPPERVDGAFLLRRLLAFKGTYFPYADQPERCSAMVRHPSVSSGGESNERLGGAASGGAAEASDATAAVRPVPAISGRRQTTTSRSPSRSLPVTPVSPGGFIFPATPSGAEPVTTPTQRVAEGANTPSAVRHDSRSLTGISPREMDDAATSEHAPRSPGRHRRLSPPLSTLHQWPAGREPRETPLSTGPSADEIRWSEMHNAPHSHTASANTAASRAGTTTTTTSVSSPSQQSLSSASSRAIFSAEHAPLMSGRPTPHSHASTPHLGAAIGPVHTTVVRPASQSGDAEGRRRHSMPERSPGTGWVRLHEHSYQNRYTSGDAPWLALHRNERAASTGAYRLSALADGLLNEHDASVLALSELFASPNTSRASPFPVMTTVVAEPAESNEVPVSLQASPPPPPGQPASLAERTMLEVGSLVAYPQYEKMLISGKRADVVLAVTELPTEKADESDERKRESIACSRPCTTFFRAHKLVLSTASPFFEMLLYHSDEGSAGFMDTVAGDGTHVEGTVPRGSEGGEEGDAIHICTLEPPSTCDTRRSRVPSTHRRTSSTASTTRTSASDTTGRIARRGAEIPCREDTTGCGHCPGVVHVPVIELTPRSTSKETSRSTVDPHAPSPAFPLTATLLAQVLLFIYTGNTYLVGGASRLTSCRAPDTVWREDAALERQCFSSLPPNTPWTPSSAPVEVGVRHGRELVQLLWASEYFMLPALSSALLAALPDFLRVGSPWPVLTEARRLGLRELVDTLDTWVRRHVWDLLRDTRSLVRCTPRQLAELIAYHHRRQALPVPGEKRKEAGKQRTQSIAAWEGAAGREMKAHLGKDEADNDSEATSTQGTRSPLAVTSTLPPHHAVLPSRNTNPMQEPLAGASAGASPLPRRGLLVPTPPTLHLMDAERVGPDDDDDAYHRFITPQEPLPPPPPVLQLAPLTEAQSRGRRQHGAGVSRDSRRSGRRSAASPSPSPTNHRTTDRHPPASPEATSRVAARSSPRDDSLRLPMPDTLELGHDAPLVAPTPTQVNDGDSPSMATATATMSPMATLGAVRSVSSVASVASAYLSGWSGCTNTSRDAPASSTVHVPLGGVFLGPVTPARGGEARVRLLSTEPLLMTAPVRLHPSQSLRATAAMSETEVARQVLLWLAAWRRQPLKKRETATLPFFVDEDSPSLEEAVTITLGSLYAHVMDKELLEDEIVPILRDACPHLAEAFTPFDGKQ